MAGVKGKSGRKTRAEEFGLATLIESRLPKAKQEKIIDNLYKFAVGANPKAAVGAATLLFAYAYGKPTERHEHSFDLSGLTDEELTALEPIVRKLTRP